MNEEEIMKKYDHLYEKMATSNNIENMKLFGKVGREAMVQLAKHAPEKAQELVEELCAINWDNYLTEREAEKIVSNMVPQRPWPKEQWRVVMEQHGYKLEEEPYYNKCALYVTMSMIYSDSHDTIERYMNPDADAFEIIHSLAIDKLKDKDGVFSIRSYFSL